MYTSIGLVALAGFFVTPSSLPASPTWRLGYEQARQEGLKATKPLAVVIGSGPEGFHELSTEGKLSAQAQQLLAKHYIPVYVDASTPAGRKLAAAFDIEGTGIVISDGGGAVQAFYHEGSLDDDALARYLRRFADPRRVPRTTEQVRAEQISYYPPQEDSFSHEAVGPSFAPAFFGGGMSGGACRT